MFDQIYDFFQEQISQNMLFQGGFALSILGALALIAKKCGLTVWAWIKRKTSFSVSVSLEDSYGAYKALVFYFSKLASEMNNYAIFNDNNGPGGQTDYRIPIGRTIIWKPMPIFVEFERRKLETATSIYSTYNSFINIHGFGAKKVINRILADAKKEYEIECAKKFKTPIKRMNPDGKIDDLCDIMPKPLDNIILKDGNMPELKRLLNNWKEEVEKYRSLGMPHKLGMLLHGTPGTGKSSLGYSIARFLNFKVIQADLYGLAQSGLTHGNTVYILDDVDRILKTTIGFESKKPSLSSGTTLKNLLETLDARVSAENVIIILTCNDVSSLDPAIYRPGRIDWICEFSPPTQKMAEELMSKFYDKKIALNGFIDGMAMSYYQSCCLRHLYDHELAIKEALNPESSLVLRIAS